MAAAVDDFTGRTNIMNPATNAVVVTPSDTVNLSHVSRALWVGVAGDVTVVMADNAAANTSTLFTALSIGWHPLRVSRVNATATTATNITAVW